MDNSKNSKWHKEELVVINGIQMVRSARQPHHGLDSSGKVTCNKHLAIVNK